MNDGGVSEADVDGGGPGDAVEVYLAESRRRLRFQLGAVDYRAWRTTADELGALGLPAPVRSLLLQINDNA